MRTVIAVGLAVLMLVTASSTRHVVRHGASHVAARIQASNEFAPISTLMNEAIAADKLPGGVVEIGHGGKPVFQHAYGSRKLAGEPGLNGSPAPAEPMTDDTIFDIASLTKPLATATAVMQLYELGRVAFDEPVQTYLPDFNATNDPVRQRVTVRMLLTHTSGEPIDVNLADPWGLDRPDKAEGIRRAITTPLQSGPGAEFRYSDINYILLGAMVERLSGEPEDEYAQRNIFAPLGMAETRYLPPASLVPRIAPTAIDNESSADPSKNPDFGHLLRGVVHDPTARRMGGVAGHAGVFSTARDVGRFAQALLDRLANRLSSFPLQTRDPGRDDDAPAARTQRGTGRSRERGRPESRSNDSQHHQSATRPALPGNRGAGAVRLRLGHRHRLLQAARADLPRRQLRRHGLHRNLALAGPRLRHLRRPAHERDSSAR